MIKFWKALVVCMVISLPLIYGYNIVKNKSWQLSMGVSTLGQMPPEINESSGLENGPQPGTFFTHNDRSRSGQPELFKIDKTGKLLKTYTIAGAASEDWEDLAQDDSGNLYIGDVGNNNGNRKTLSVYKINAASPGRAETISFTYNTEGEGKSGKKGKKSSAVHNAEALFWSKGKLYIVTKNNTTADIFELPDSPGKHVARHLGSKDIGDKITGADLSPDGSKLALISIGKLYLFPVTDDNFLKYKPQVVDLGNVGQTEGVVFTGNSTLIFSNEGGQLFKYSF